MGKASTWLVNFLLGRKDDKGKRKNLSISFDEENLVPSPSATPSSPSLFKRRWSFRKLSSKDRAHKSSRSLDSMTATPVLKQAVFNMEIRHDNMRVFAMSMLNSNRRKTKARYAAVENAAATRIQAAFRSYLVMIICSSFWIPWLQWPNDFYWSISILQARKALYALRGLVKLQALVRGYLVRKQTTATLRSMHALMSIQVRARFQRIQMADQSQLDVKSQSLRYGRFLQEMEFKRSQRVSSFHHFLSNQTSILVALSPNSTTNCYVDIGRY